MSSRKQRSYWILAAVVALLAAGLMFYAETRAFAWDEGFHLLTAQLITRGKRPWIDFNFSQTPLNAYWNAFWFLIFGDTWHTAHAIATLMTAAAIMLTADYVFTCFPVVRWRFPAALLTVLLLGLNVLIVQFGTIGQAYALALFLIVSAFRLTVLSADRTGVLLAAAAGLLASAAAGSTQLTSPVFVVLAVWMVVQNRAGNRWAKLTAFLAAGVVPMLPIAWLFLQGPKQAFFNIIQYNLIFRQVEWPSAIEHDIGVMLAWLHSAQALLIGLLALAGLLTIRFRNSWFPEAWTQPQRAEAYLCGWIALALGVFISSAHPTFQRYYLFSMPFLAILAAAGFYALLTRIYIPDRPFWPILALALIFSMEAGMALYDRNDDANWNDLAKVAAEADKVTPPGGLILGDEFVYLLTRRPPPSGMELADSHKLEFPPARAIPLHLVSEAEILQQLKAGRYATAVDCDKSHRIGADDFKKLYNKVDDGDTCAVYWDFKATHLHS